MPVQGSKTKESDSLKKNKKKKKKDRKVHLDTENVESNLLGEMQLAKNNKPTQKSNASPDSNTELSKKENGKSFLKGNGSKNSKDKSGSNFSNQSNPISTSKNSIASHSTDKRETSGRDPKHQSSVSNETKDNGHSYNGSQDRKQRPGRASFNNQARGYHDKYSRAPTSEGHKTPVENSNMEGRRRENRVVTTDGQPIGADKTSDIPDAKILPNNGHKYGDVSSSENKLDNGPEPAKAKDSPRSVPGDYSAGSCRAGRGFASRGSGNYSRRSGGTEYSGTESGDYSRTEDFRPDTGHNGDIPEDREAPRKSADRVLDNQSRFSSRCATQQFYCFLIYINFYF